MVVVDLADLSASCRLLLLCPCCFCPAWRIVFAFYRSAFIFAFQSCFWGNWSKPLKPATGPATSGGKEQGQESCWYKEASFEGRTRCQVI